jgi:hypothetical protein
VPRRHGLGGVRPEDRGGHAAEGDKITGEIKTYSQGRLSVDTSYSDWVSVKWNKILSIGGRYLVQENQKWLVVFAGILANREQPVEGDGKYNAEATLGARYSYFMSTTGQPKNDWGPALSVGGQF